MYAGGMKCTKGKDAVNAECSMLDEGLERLQDSIVVKCYSINFICCRKVRRRGVRIANMESQKRDLVH